MLDPHCVEAATERLPVARKLLAAAAAERGGPMAQQWKSPYTDQSWRFHVSNASSVAALEIQNLVNSGQVSEAIKLCIDGVAYTRDLGLGSGLMGLITVQGSLLKLVNPCVSALVAAGNDGRARALRALLMIQAGEATLESVVTFDAIKEQFACYADFLTEQQRARLPEAPGLSLWQPDTPAQAAVFSTPNSRGRRFSPTPTFAVSSPTTGSSNSRRRTQEPPQALQ